MNKVLKLTFSLGIIVALLGTLLLSASSASATITHGEHPDGAPFKITLENGGRLLHQESYGGGSFNRDYGRVPPGNVYQQGIPECPWAINMGPANGLIRRFTLFAWEGSRGSCTKGGAGDKITGTYYVAVNGYVSSVRECAGIAQGGPRRDCETGETGEDGGGTTPAGEEIPRGDGFTETDCSNIRTRPGRCNIIKLANTVIKFLSAVVGVVITAMIIVGGIRYASAGGDPQAVGTAKNMIRNAIIALVAYIFLLAFLKWVVPGGIV